MRGIKQRTNEQSIAAWYAMLGRDTLKYQLERAKINVQVGMHMHCKHKTPAALSMAMRDARCATCTWL